MELPQLACRETNGYHESRTCSRLWRIAMVALAALAFVADASGGTSRFRPGPGSFTILMSGK
jgi:hypothetical protein